MEVESAMDAAAFIAGTAAVVSVLSLILGVLNNKRAEHQNLIKALQGDRESIAYIAYRFSRDGRWPRSKSQREHIIEALCLSAIFEPSDRARVFIFSALCDYPDKGQVVEVLQSVVGNFQRFREQLDLRRGIEHLNLLCRALGIEESDLHATTKA
jgi:hypothetical protein